MVLKHFCPQDEYTWGQLEKITAKAEGLWTWQTAGLLWMKAHGFEVVDIESFDYKRFIKEGEEYLKNTFGEAVTHEQIIHSNISQEIVFAQQLVDEKLSIFEVPSIQHIKKYLDKNYLIIVLLNALRLNGGKGYIGHFVVIKGYTDDHLILHDPGLPPIENRKVTYEAFEMAWADPNETAKNLYAFKK